MFNSFVNMCQAMCWQAQHPEETDHVIKDVLVLIWIYLTLYVCEQNECIKSFTSTINGNKQFSSIFLSVVSLFTSTDPHISSENFIRKLSMYLWLTRPLMQCCIYRLPSTFWGVAATWQKLSALLAGNQQLGLAQLDVYLQQNSNSLK